MGEIGEGFIEVYHIEPVSGIAAGTIVDPAKDPAPVCPNCHAMLHRVTALQQLLFPCKPRQSARNELGVRRRGVALIA